MNLGKTFGVFLFSLALAGVVAGCATPAKQTLLPPVPPSAAEPSPKLELAPPPPPPPPPPAPARHADISLYQAYMAPPSPTSVPTVQAPSTEAYTAYAEKEFVPVKDQPLSTFGIDVDTASYTNMRRFLSQGSLPPQDSIRIEELINYFKFDYPNPEGRVPFSVHVDTAACPWAEEHILARIGIKGRDVAPKKDRPGSNVVFLLDTSGSMADEDKLPLFVKGMKLLLGSLSPRDRLGIVTYSSTARVALESAPLEDKRGVEKVLDSLRADGSTNGAEGIAVAYAMARANFAEGGTNRVILCTDGDFNVGITEKEQLVQLIEREAKSGVFLTVLGFGQGNLKDTNLQSLADKGNGHYCYVDSFKEARRVLMDQVTGTMVTIAKDVKIQVEFNPAKAAGYRLIGYEKRALAARDFNDDKKDAGEIGAGQTVTALYEIVPAGKPLPAPEVDALKYQPVEKAPERATSTSPDLMTVKLRYKLPDRDESSKLEVPVIASTNRTPSTDFAFASSVAAFGMILKNSPFKGSANMDMVSALAARGKGEDPDGARAEFADLVKSTKALAR